MSDLKARLDLEADSSKVGPGLAAGQRALENVGKTAREIARDFDKARTSDTQLNRELAETAARAAAAAGGLDSAAGGAARFERSAGMARSAGLLLGSTLAYLGGREIVKSIGDAAFAMQGFSSGFEVATGSAAGARGELTWIRQEAERLAVPVRDATKSFMELDAATMGTAVAGQRTRDVWTAMTEAGQVLHTGTERQNLAMVAMQQIASKGVVSLEDLKGQLAESLPGALSVAAEAMGVSREKLLDLVGSGKVLSDDFIPKFADALHAKFGPALEASLNTPLGHAKQLLAETQTAMFDLETTAGSEFLSGLAAGLSDIKGTLTSTELLDAAKDFGHDLGVGLSVAGQAAAFLADHIKTVETAATALVAIGVSKWLVTVAADARAAALALAQKGAAAAVSGETEAVAMNTLAGIVEREANAELAAAAAALKAAVAHEEAAVAAMAEVRALTAAAGSAMTYAERQAALVAVEGEMNAARAASATAAARVETATLGVTKATGAMAGAGALARGSMMALVDLMGGPLGIGLTVIAALTWAMVEADAAATKQAQEMYQTHVDLQAALDGAANALNDAGVQAGAWHTDLTQAKGPTDDLAASTDNLADKTLKLADARRQAAMADLQASMARLRGDAQTIRDKVGLNYMTSTPGAVLLGGDQAKKDKFWQQAAKDTQVKVQVGVREDDGSPIYQTMSAGDALKRNAGDQQSVADAQAQLKAAPPPKPTKPPTTPPPAGKAKADKLEDKARNAADDLAADQAAQQAYTDAVLKGGAALDDWKIKEAGRQAVEAQGLSNRKNLTSAEQGLLDTIRHSAEETERMRLANERIGAAAGLKRSAELDTQALKDRAAAAAAGDQALEDLRVKEAGLAAQQQLGIDSLDQLDEATRKVVQSAIDAAEAKEKQAIATEKAERTAEVVRSLDIQIAQTQAYIEALKGGEKALIDYEIAEAVRQETERAGRNLTPEEIAQIKAKTEALYRLKAAADGIADQRAFSEELRLARLTTEERERENRILERKQQLLRENANYTEAEADAAAREQVAREDLQRRMAEDMGHLKDALRQAYIESGELGFDDVADYAEKKLREAVYDALLKKPIDIIVEAVVNVVTEGLDKILQDILAATQSKSDSAGGGAADGLAKGLKDQFKTLFNQLPAALQSGLKAGFQAFAYAQVGAQLANVVGIQGSQKDPTGQMILDTAASAIGNAVGGPIGAVVATIISRAIGPAIFGKESNYGAVATFDGTGGFTVSGSKRNAQTEKAVSQAAGAITDLVESLGKIGIDASNIIKSIDVGTRDPSKIRLADGTTIKTRKGDMEALVNAAGLAMLKAAHYDDPREKALVDQMIAANKSFQDIADKLGEFIKAQDYEKDIKLALLKLTDPRAAALQQLHDDQQARRDQVAKYAAEGFYTDSQLADLQHTLDALDNAELAAALENLGDAATDAAKALKDAQPRLREWLDALGFKDAAQLNPFEERQLAMAQYERQLELARAGNADALDSLTSYADRLIEADEAATSSAFDRLNLFNKIQADIAALAALAAPIGASTTTAGGSATTSSSVVEASAGSSTGVTAQATSADIATLTEAVNGLRSDLNRRLDQLGEGFGGLVGGVGDELASILRRVEQGGAGAAAALQQLAGDTRLAGLLAAANAARLTQ